MGLGPVNAVLAFRVADRADPEIPRLIRLLGLHLGRPVRIASEVAGVVPHPELVGLLQHRAVKVDTGVVRRIGEKT